jgi:hypothetical protein
MDVYVAKEHPAGLRAVRRSKWLLPVSRARRRIIRPLTSVVLARRAISSRAHLSTAKATPTTTSVRLKWGLFT